MSAGTYEIANPRVGIHINIRDLRCEVGATVYTLVQFELEIHAFCGAIYMRIQSSMRADLFSMRVDLHKEWS